MRTSFEAFEDEIRLRALIDGRAGSGEPRLSWAAALPVIVTAAGAVVALL